MTMSTDTRTSSKKVKNNQQTPGKLPPFQIPDTRVLLKHAETTRAGVRFTPGAACGGDPGCIRLCFAFYSPDELKLGVERLALAIETFLRAL